MLATSVASAQNTYARLYIDYQLTTTLQEKGWTMLHVAADRGDAATVRELFQLQNSINASPVDKVTTRYTGMSSSSSTMNRRTVG